MSISSTVRIFGLGYGLVILVILGIITILLWLVAKKANLSG
jgi:hypothetical protein